MAKAIELRQPALTPYVYVKATSGGVPITIALTDFTGTVDLEFSVDNGSNWFVIGSTSDATYTWNPHTAYNDIFDSGDDTISMIVRATDGDGSATVTVTACKVSMEPVNIKPDKDSTNCNGLDTTFGNHDTPYFYLDGVNIIWSEMYDSPTDSYDVYVVNTSDVETLLYSGVSKAEMNLSWVFGAYLVGSNPLITSNGNYLYAIRIKGTGNHTGNVATGSYFAITTTDLTQEGTAMERYRLRLETFRRVAIEKGILVDEALSLGQLEAGAGIRITQRNGDGKRVNSDGGPDLSLNDPVDYKRAFNLVIEADVSSLPRQKRAKQGWINPSNLVGPPHEAGVYYLGSMFSIDLNHGWNLGVEGDPNYIEGQTMNHYQLHLTHVAANGSFVQPQHEIKPMIETKDANAVTIYAVKKGGDYQPALEKDEVSDTLLDTWFYYTIEEVIPYPVD